MAMSQSAMTAKSGLTQITKDHLECTICCHRFSQPKMLECLHNFCLECLEMLKEQVGRYSSRLRCPICRQDTLLKDNSVEKLPSDSTLSGLVEEVAKQEQLLQGQGSSVDVREKWRLETEVGGYIPKYLYTDSFKRVFHVASFSDNVALAIEFGKNELKRILASSKPTSPVLCHDVEMEDLENPRRLAINKDDEIIVLSYSDEKHQVEVFAQNKELLHYFELDEVNGPSCLAVNENNQIVIGSSYCHKIYVFSPEGSLQDTLSEHSVSEHIAYYKQRFIYTNFRQRKLRSIDGSGEEIFTADLIGDAPSMGPSGVCCDSDGDIYVAMNVDWSSTGGEIHQFSADGEHLGCVIKGCGSPRGLALTPRGDLVVAARESVIIYRPV